MQKALSKWCRNVRPAMAPLDSKSSLICVRNPATHHILAEIPPCGALEAQEAIATAQKTFRDAQDNNACSKSQDSVTFLRSPTERAHFLYRYATALSSHREDLAHIITGESGKPLSESLAEVDYAADYIQCFAGEAERIYGHVLPRRGSSTSGSHMFMFHEPVGVVAMITPWNFPLAMLMRKFGAACAAGNTVVAKVSELTPLTAIAAKEIAVRDCGLPEGILNVLYGDAAAIGEVMCSNLGVRVLSFTGSTRVGALLRRNAAIHIRTVMELGGNAPFIVFADADLKLAVRAAMASKFRNAGQTCISPNRFLVHREIHDEFVDALQREMERKLIVGDGMLPGVTMGPLIHVTAAKRVRGDIEEALQHGAVKAWECPQHGAYMTSQEVDSTAFVPPTLLTHCSPKNPIFKKELFAPVVAVTPFETESEAVTLSNQTPYGLASYCFTNDLGRSLRVARLSNVGMVGVNESAISMVHAPFGGIGISGHGREGGQYGVLEYMEMKYCCIKGGESSSS